MLLIAFAGLPGTGKSTLARAVSKELGAPILDKDVIRAATFGTGVDYSREQDDLVCREIHAQVESLARANSIPCVILDGRTYSRRYQVDELRELARRSGAMLRLIECECSEATARTRLERDAREASHVAANRNFELYTTLARDADLIEGHKLVLRTDDAPLHELVERCIAYARGES